MTALPWQLPQLQSPRFRLLQLAPLLLHLACWLHPEPALYRWQEPTAARRRAACLGQRVLAGEVQACALQGQPVRRFRPWLRLLMGLHLWRRCPLLSTLLVHHWRCCPQQAGAPSALCAAHCVAPVHAGRCASRLQSQQAAGSGRTAAQKELEAGVAVSVHLHTCAQPPAQAQQQRHWNGRKGPRGLSCRQASHWRDACTFCRRKTRDAGAERAGTTSQDATNQVARRSDSAVAH